MTIYGNNTDYETKEVKKAMEDNDIQSGEYFCPVCGKRESDWSGECPTCKNKLVYVCEECGELFYMNEDEREDNCGNLICQQCFYDNYQCCDRCGDTTRIEDITTVTVDRRGHTECWCEDCLSSHATQCEICEEYYRDELIHNIENSTTEDTIDICDDCYESHCECCESCDEVIYNSIYHNGESLCRSCYEERLAEEEMNDEDNDREEQTEYARPAYERIIYGYHGCPTFHKLNFIEGENQNYFRDENLHLGIELEMENQESDAMAKEIIEASGYKFRDDMFVVMHDGSLTNGFEIVSQPATYEAHVNKLNWEKILKKARHLGFRSHNGGNCGLHFHFDREYFDNVTKREVEAKFIVLLVNNADWLQEFSRRKNWRYCAFPNLYKFKNATLQDVAYHRDCFEGHGSCMNLSNDYSSKNTIELRFIRGTLIYETFLAALQLMQIIGKIVNNFTFLQIQELGITAFVQLAKQYGFKEFTAYLKKKDLIDVDPFEEVDEEQQSA